jgi:hypothetical protein
MSPSVVAGLPDVHPTYTFFRHDVGERGVPDGLSRGGVPAENSTTSLER